MTPKKNVEPLLRMETYLNSDLQFFCGGRMADITSYFETFLTKEPLFVNKKVLQSDFVPEELDHRQDAVKTIAEVLAPALRLERPSNLFMYGKTGSGKTVTVHFTTNKILEVAKARNIPLHCAYVNCKLKKVADTEYRMLAEIIRSFGRQVPATGLPTDEIYRIFLSILEEDRKHVILILDEIDQLVDKVGDEILYSLTRMNADLKESSLSFIGISNDLVFVNTLDPRVKSSLSEEEIVFSPYNAPQLEHILRKRAAIAFKEGVIGDAVLAKCAAYAAREHGDARRALELLRVAGELAEREGKSVIDVEHIDHAESKIERDRIIDSVAHQPKQFHLVIYSILLLDKQSKMGDSLHTGDVYELYEQLCKQTHSRPLTQRRVSDIVGELDMLGIIRAKTISKGRYGRTRDITLCLPSHIVQKLTTLLKSKLDIHDTSAA